MLIGHVQRAVREKFDVELVREVRIVGAQTQQGSGF
jgi:UDP-N-acetylenolpyruvoylglucosamine reductase